MKEIIWINGKLVKKENAKLSIFDHGFLYGDGLFETMRAYNGKIFRLDDHINRLFSGLKILKIKIPYTKAFLKFTVSKLTKTLKSEGVYARISVSRGEGKVGLDPALCKRPNVIIYLKLFNGYPESYYKKGAKVIISSIRSNNQSPLSRIKSNNYLNNILALIEAKKKNKDDAALLNTEGFVAELTTSNIFIVKGKRLITPPAGEGLLSGVTRNAIMKIASRLGFKVLEKRIKVNELKSADETFLTNSIAEIRGITEIDDVQVSKGRAGSVTQLLHCQYQELVRKELKR